ncbi:TIGR02530 family flagellar biosynthesis protein [Clostridium sp. C2-6-12]|uniref:TIGR02530 family flagellar biosynthesis protein n=1 Tax=Clostridium sp. C2-6-12 TaxID=2698832 RepID=UPI00136CF46C|nr:TIGR02530 family flagellar biosynthesis protein [Clostridium sp. C2-6-12]
MSYRIVNGQIYSVGNIGQNIVAENRAGRRNDFNTKANFQQVLDNVVKKDDGFTVSKHAALRLKEINFTQDDMKQIEKGFEIAKDKNSRNTVMLYKDVALIASVENKTIITAVEKERAKDNVFTNIDSVVIL